MIALYGVNPGCYEHKAAQLASRGVAAMAVAYFKYEDLPGTLQPMHVDYFQDAVDYLHTIKEVTVTQ